MICLRSTDANRFDIKVEVINWSINYIIIFHNIIKPACYHFNHAASFKNYKNKETYSFFLEEMYQIAPWRSKCYRTKSKIDQSVEEKHFQNHISSHWDSNPQHSAKALRFTVYVKRVATWATWSPLEIWLLNKRYRNMLKKKSMKYSIISKLTILWNEIFFLIIK